VILLIGYILIYQFAPFKEPWSDIILNTLTPVAAAFAAIIASLIFFYYEKDDAPRRIWKSLMIGSWLWFAAEAIWSYQAMTLGEAPNGIVDVSWVLGFIFFTLALYDQHSLINPSKKILYRNIVLGAWAVVLLIPVPIVFFTKVFTFKTYIDFFYPFADLAVGVAGILLILAFQGGSLIRPWIGLVVFGVTDFLYAWAEQIGLYSWSAENGNPLSLLIDSSYMAAYLILGLGFLGHWVLIRYGLTTNLNPYD
jgi:hypothetical protein